MKSYGTLVGELPTGIEFVVEGALLRIYFDFERREAVQKAGSEDVVVEDQYVCGAAGAQSPTRRLCLHRVCRP